MNQEKAPEPVTAIVCLDEDEVEPLTGEPFFHMTISKSHLNQGHLPIPAKFAELLPKNKAAVPMVLSRGSRSWHMKFYGSQYSQRRFGSGWKAFVKDNMLNLGDVCLFELMSTHVTSLKFKVQILRGDLPPALLNREGQPRVSPVLIEIE
ncbi:B3 domain-containing protein Os06g0112300-like [Silene latifolia]|uniref:B3 domain-containing protein Os06g0112300-like n=1 Tax=Silene latifolia TaxID=37657 RepID=UPI003D78A2B3